MIHFLRIGLKRWIYFGHEDEIPTAKVWERFWFIEENPPYRIGNGWRMKEDHDVAFHFGIATRISDRSELEILGGSNLPATPTEIGLWGATTEEPPGDTGESPAAPDPTEYVGTADLHRVSPDAGEQHVSV